MGRSGHPVQNPAGRIGNRFASACTSLDGSRLGARARRALEGCRASPPPRASPAHAPARTRPRRAREPAPVYSPARGRMLLAEDLGLKIGVAQDHVEGLLDEFGLAFLDDHDSALAGAEADDFIIDQRIGDVENIQRHLGVADRIGKADELECTEQRIVQAALHDDSDLTARAAHEFVQTVLADEGERRRPALDRSFLARARSSPEAARSATRRARGEQARLEP